MTLAATAPITADEAFDRVRLPQRRSATDIEWRLGAPAAAADLAGRRLILADGTELGYDVLVAASGLRPRRLTLPGPARGRAALRTLEDCLDLGRRLRPGSSVAVVGAGFIGCEIACTAAALGCRVTLVEPQPQPLARSLGPAVGAAIAEYLAEQGIAVRTGTSVTEIQGSVRDPGTVGAIVLTHGTVIPADVLVEALGSIPNTEWAQGNDLDLSEGFRCDNYLRVEGRPEFVAVGDVARFPNLRLDGEPRRVEHWAMPSETARRAAGTLIAGLDGGPADSPFAPLPSFWSDLGALRLQSFGAPALGDRSSVMEGTLGSPEDLVHGVAIGYHRGPTLVGVLLVNLPAARRSPYRALLDGAGD
jgi:NADPH-dependent 2,4-dienoyl-CoA reductase/sulfur reductase-like enzyme